MKKWSYKKTISGEEQWRPNHQEEDRKESSEEDHEEGCKEEKEIALRLLCFKKADCSPPF